MTARTNQPASAMTYSIRSHSEDCERLLEGIERMLIDIRAASRAGNAGYRSMDPADIADLFCLIADLAVMAQTDFETLRAALPLRIE